MPSGDPACNGLRAHLPLFQALAANSPFWHGRDSGLASARAHVFRALPRSEIPPAFASYDEYAENVEVLATAGGLPDYTFLWWDIRLHPVLGTVEVRAMDCQSSLADVAGLGALVHALARHAAEAHGPWEHRDVITESSFRAARDGLDAMLWYDDAFRPVPEIARATVQLALPYARELGCDGALDEIERMLVDGNGAVRRRAAFARGGMPEVLADLVDETAQPSALVMRGAAAQRLRSQPMCRLFGMTGGTREVQATFWLLDAPASLLLQSENQPDGVGLGTFNDDGTPNGLPQAGRREPQRDVHHGAHDVRSRTFLAHIRHATEAEPSLENTHPFEQHGRLLAHNGVIGGIPELRGRLGRHLELVHGQTDSEHFFALITKRIEEHGGDVAAGIGAAARELAASFPLYSLNIVADDAGRALGASLPRHERALDPRALARRHRIRRGLRRAQRRRDDARPVRRALDPPGDRDRLRAHGRNPVAAARVRRADPRRSAVARHLDDRVPDQPANMIDLTKMSARAAIAQGEEPAAETGRK